MGKFSLLTTLSLNAAGFNSGIDQATKKTQSFKKGTTEASKSISTSFQNMSGVLGGAVNSQVGMLSESIMSGISAFRAMVPAINGVKIALISSGIGAIVVAIGLAFAALTSYFTGTSEGADKLNIILGYLKGTFTAIIKRVNFLGSALVKLFEGDFKGMRQDFEEAFKGGLFDEIKQAGSAGVAFAKEENRLKKEGLEISVEQSRLDAEMAKFKTGAKDKLSDISERMKQQNEFKIRDAKLDEKKQKYLLDEVILQEAINKSKGDSLSYDDIELLNQKKVAYYNELKADAEEQASVNKIDFQLRSNKEDEKEKIITKETNDLFEERGKILRQLSQIKYEEKVSKKFPEFSGLDDEYEIDDINIDTSVIFDKIMKFNDFLKDMNSIIKDSLMDLGTTIGEGLGNLFDSDKLNDKGFGYKILNVFGSFIKTLGSAVLSFGIAMQAFQVALKNIFSSPYLAIGAGIALIAAGTAVTNYVNKGLEKYENGGIIGGNSFSGDKVLARVNSGEMILNSSQQKRLFDIANGGGGYGGGIPQTIELVARGNDLIGVINLTNRKINSYR